MPDDENVTKLTYNISTKLGGEMTVYDTRKVITMDDGSKSMIGMLTDRNIDDYFS